MNYTKEQIDWIKNNYIHYGKHAIVDVFNKHFNENRSLDSLWWKIRKLGLTGNGESYRIQMCQNKSSVPLGTEYIDSFGYTLVKVKDTVGGRSKNWKLKQRVIWENNFGPIPKNHVVLFLDNDKTNFSLDNLLCVPTSVTGVLAKKGWYTSDGNLTKAAVNWVLLFQASGYKSVLNPSYRDDTLYVTQETNDIL